MKLTVNTFVTLDGVMQGPGGPDEDRSGGFDHGGWLVPFADEGFGRIVVGWFSQVDAFLLGRNTYQIFQSFWPQVTDRNDPVATKLNSLPKYVASTTLTEATWAHSTVIDDITTAVAELKSQPGRELQVHGSCSLVHSLHDAGLIDEYRLIQFPIVVGRGKRLFPDGAVPSTLELVASETTDSGALGLTFRPAAPKAAAEILIEDGKEVIRPVED